MASYEDLESIHCSEIGYTGGRPGFPRHSLDGVIIRPRCMGNVKRGNGIRSRMVFTVPSGPCSRCSCCSGRANYVLLPWCVPLGAMPAEPPELVPGASKRGLLGALRLLSPSGSWCWSVRESCMSCTRVLMAYPDQASSLQGSLDVG